jgi:hypothetical protein
MDAKWERINTKTNKILLKSKLEEDDVRNEKIEIENNIKQDGFSKKYNDFKGSYELQYWVDKDICDEYLEIIEFNKKLEKWELGKFIDDNIILSINDNIDFNKFNFTKDKNYNEEYNNYLLTYKEKTVIFKIPETNVEVINNFNNKCIRLQYDNMDKTFISFFDKLENRIIKCVENDNNNFNIDLNKYAFNSNKKHKHNQTYMEFKVKKDSIEDRLYNNAVVYIKCNRLWKFNYENRDGQEIYIWGVSMVVDKIMENN